MILVPVLSLALVGAPRAGELVVPLRGETTPPGVARCRLYTSSDAAAFPSEDGSGPGIDATPAPVGLDLSNNPGPGVFASSFTTASDGSLNGQSLYLVVGNGGNVSTSSALALLDTGLSFSLPDHPGPPQALNYTIRTSAIIVLGDLIDDASADWSFANQPDFTGAGLMMVVPEPASSSLLALAGMTLMGRRRR